VAAAELPSCDPDNGGITVPDGFCALVVADGLGRARHLTVSDRGDIYVALASTSRAKGGIMVLRDTTGDGRADVRQQFADGEIGGTGIGIRNGYLYLGRNTAIVRYRLGQDGLVPAGPAEVVVAEGFPDSRGHQPKPIAFDDKGFMYVTVGAPSNSCEQERAPHSPGRDPCPELEWTGGIWRFDANTLGQTQKEHGVRYASGIRNAVAIEWNHAAGALYAVQHGRDRLDFMAPEHFTAEQDAELPAEEFLRIEERSVFGWPYCYYDQLQRRRVLAPEYGGDGKRADRCEKYPDPILAFPGHYAPNDLFFYTGGQFPERFRNGAFVTFHGSQQRTPLPEQGYKVAFVPFKGRLPSADWEVFADGFSGGKPLASPRDATFRPMGLAQGRDGSLYLSDSSKGRIWRVVYRGKPTVRGMVG
jgi:glucose/arabinose dehydrogenase